MRARTWVLTAIATLMTVLCTVLWWVEPALAAEVSEAPPQAAVGATRWIYIAAAMTTSTSTIAAAYAVARAATAAIGAMTEKPELFGRMIVVVGLAEGIAIYGLIVSILLLSKLG